MLGAMHSRLWLLLLGASALPPLFGAAGCSFQSGQLPPDAIGDPIPDAVDAPPTCTSFSSQVDTCGLTESMQDLTLTGMNTYDTAAGTLVAGSSPIAIERMQVAGKAGPIELVVVRDLHMTANARLRASGTMPLAILAFGTITLDAGAVIDVSAGGAGARTTCPGGAIAGTPADGGAGGGGGGGFAAAGGDGGNGNSDGRMPSPGGPGGAAATSAPLGPLGGCPGAGGGNGDDSGGAGGAAGGALYLVAANGIELGTGSVITAGGAGGKGGTASTFSNGDAGGGGGGSGGMIMIESPMVRSGGALTANGGGGGEASGDGSDGKDGDTGTTTTAAANGGSGGSPTGTNGGSGGAQLSPQGASVTAVDKGGGGGGGGSVGYILILSDDAMIVLASPNPN